MKLTRTTSEIFVPDGSPAAGALERTTHLAVAAHQDDVEIMALEGILAGFGSGEEWFTAAIVTDGAGSPRDGLYAGYTDEEMRAVRRVEQKKAAYVGEYSAVAFLDYPSSAVKNAADPGPVEDLKALITAAQPRIIYTHNLADKHDTHVAVALRVIAALRALPPAARPRKLYGCEVWRDLDWMVDADKVVFQFDQHENIAAALVGIFNSQIAGGKRYDLATIARRRANATYHQSHAVDVCQQMSFGMDLTPLIEGTPAGPGEYVQEYISRFAADVSARIAKMS